MTATQITDVARIEHATMRLVAPALNATALSSTIQTATKSIVLHGKRHSQGGHTLLNDGISLDIEPFQTVSITETAQQCIAKIDSGATWDHLHGALFDHPTRWAPRTHQSSPYFSIGGSLAVNCHGRDPLQPPLAGAVTALKVMLANGTEVDASPGTNADLFHAILGGHGSCGIITTAWLDLKREKQLRHQAHTGISLQRYCEELTMRARGQLSWPAMHHAFLNFVPGQLFTDVVSVDSIDTSKPVSGDLKHESFVSDAVLRTIYSAYRAYPALKGKVWDEFKDSASNKLQGEERQLNAMRANVHFTLLMDDDTTDLLQEYFLPPDRLKDFLENCARGVLQSNNVNLLSSTVRVVQQDHHTLLNYAPDGVRASVVFNFNIRKQDAIPDANGNSQLSSWTRQLIEGALSRGGSFYLPYARTATLDQFRRAYPRWRDFCAVRRRFDPDLRFDNNFLRAYQL